MRMSKSKRWIVGLVVLVVLGVGIKEGRHYVFVDNFDVVEEGVLYRTGQPKPYQLARLIEEYGIKTVINTREEHAPEELMAKELAVCEAAGIKMVRMSMPGDGRGTYDQYREALALLDDPESLPALVHCARGTHRTGAIVGSYRVLRQGWEPAAAIEEMTKYRFKTEDHELVPHLEKFWAEAKKDGLAGDPQPEIE